MKIVLKSIAVLCLIVFGPGIAGAQATDGETPMFGIKAGLNGSYLYSPDEDVSDREGKFGFAGGFFAKAPLGDVVSLQPELLFSMKGDEYRFGSDERAIRLNLNYAELPVGLHFDVLDVINIHGGGYVGYLVNSKFKRVGGDGEVEGEAELDADDFNRLDYGWFAGAGVNVGNLGVSFRFNQGLNQLYKSDVLDLFGNVKNINGTLALSVAF